MTIDTSWVEKVAPLEALDAQALVQKFHDDVLFKKEDISAFMPQSWPNEWVTRIGNAAGRYLEDRPDEAGITVLMHICLALKAYQEGDPSKGHEFEVTDEQLSEDLSTLATFIVTWQSMLPFGGYESTNTTADNVFDKKLPRKFKLSPTASKTLETIFKAHPTKEGLEDFFRRIGLKGSLN